MAVRLIQVQDADAVIKPTTWSVDPLSNPYLVYNQERSTEAGQPVFTNVARNMSSTWAPPEVAGDPAMMKYWEQVPEFERQHERVYATEHGPMSESDIRKYGLDGKRKVNWLPWIVAGGAVAYAATELM